MTYTKVGALRPTSVVIKLLKSHADISSIVTREISLLVSSFVTHSDRLTPTDVDGFSPVFHWRSLEHDGEGGTVGV